MNAPVARRAARELQPGSIGKAELAAALGWTRPKLDRRLESDARFPVISRGTHGGGWAFNLAAVKAYLAGGQVPSPPSQPTPPVIDPAQLAAAVAPPTPRPTPRVVEHFGETTNRQRKEGAQASLLEDKLRREREELVEREEVVQVLHTMVAHLGKSLDGLPDAVVKMLGLPESAVPVLRELIDDIRQSMVKDLKRLLVDG